MNILTAAILALLLTSASALQAACPELAGNYTCHDYGKYDLQISQSIDGDGVTTYTMSAKNSHGVATKFLIADGIYRNKDDWRFSYSCDENGTLRTPATVDEYDVSTTSTITANGSFMTETTYKNRKSEEAENYTMICRPQSM